MGHLGRKKKKEKKQQPKNPTLFRNAPSPPSHSHNGQELHREAIFQAHVLEMMQAEATCVEISSLGVS